jgi:Uma2 family endonuclease
MTTLEYLETPETVLPSELAFGVLRVADSPSATHQRAVGDLFLELAPFVRDRGLGEVLIAPMDVVLDFDRALVVQPDLLFVSSARRHIIVDRVYGAPDLVVEVLSPYPRIGRLEDRLMWFARYGVRECWIVRLAERRLEVLTLDQRGVVTTTAFEPGSHIRSTVLPEFARPLEVFGW